MANYCNELFKKTHEILNQSFIEKPSLNYKFKLNLSHSRNCMFFNISISPTIYSFIIHQSIYCIHPSIHFSIHPSQLSIHLSMHPMI